MKNVVQMVDGEYIDLLNPDFSKTKIESIAWALSNICRFNGHTSSFYSVAQHSVLISYLVPEHLAYDALMHDSAEAIIGDVASPLKNLLPDYQAMEKRIETALFDRLGVTYPLSPEIKQADLVMLKAEREFLMPDTGEQWSILNNIANNAIKQICLLKISHHFIYSLIYGAKTNRS